MGKLFRLACSCVTDLLLELLQVRLLVFQELELVFALSLLLFPAKSILRFNILLACLQFSNLVFVLRTFNLQFFHCLDQLRHTMLGLKLFTHGEVNWSVVEGLVSANSIAALVANTEQKESTLWLSKSYLTNDLIEALGEKILSNWANTGLTGLSLFEAGVKSFSQTRNIDSSGLFVGDILNIVFFIFEPLTWWENGINNVLSVWFSLQRWQSTSFTLGAYGQLLVKLICVGVRLWVVDLLPNDLRKDGWVPGTYIFDGYGLMCNVTSMGLS